ncbi:aminoglycoside phosphotransferase family protein [Teredinibacter turnerae]|uniref:aminoglycoside phosphotransferase family protein n=1 Tax=Teredinibacter turnerae TaxID=2426 RepID=UPI0003A3FD51|nr:phosphotransferase [Teredinibacter turnerae]
MRTSGGDVVTGVEIGELNDTAASLRRWVSEQLQARGYCVSSDGIDDWYALGGDAGSRHYFRFTLTGAVPITMLAVWAPPRTEKNTEFLQIANIMREQGVAVPEIIAFDMHLGFFIIEDLGTESLLEKLNGDTANTLYPLVFDQLLKIQTISAAENPLPRYDGAFLLREMQLFREWFLEALLNVELDSDAAQMLDDLFAILVENALAQPVVVTHRDFHARNLIYRGEQPPGVIDFQDAVAGPITYDLVSLLKDCYIAWPRPQVVEWVQLYCEFAWQKGLLSREVDEESFIRWFDWMGLQRHIKVAGIFARLHLRDGKSGYLNDVPRVLAYIVDTASAYPEFDAFHRWLTTQLQPVIAQQTWGLHD